MNQEQIIQWAKEADSGFTGNDDRPLGTSIVGIDAITAFAKLVAQQAIANALNRKAEELRDVG